MKNCNSCGKCCIKYSNGGLSASAEDLELWEEYRPDISRYVADQKIWMNPETGEQIERCPFLREEPRKGLREKAGKDATQAVYTCDIYYDRPEDCRVYPATITDMIKDDCEMLETHDLTNLKQAQRELNKIMIVSE